MARRLPARLPAPVLAVVRLLGLPVGEVTRYWVQERAALRRGLIALLLAATADLAAGIVLGKAETQVAELPGLLVLIPAAIAMRGATFGALGARLGTAIHTGEYDPSLERGGYLWRQLEATAVLTLVTSVEAALLAKALSVALGLAAVPVWDLLAVSVIGGVLASVVLVVVTLLLARTAQRRRWNMDDVGAPSITATGDLLAVPALLAATILTRRGTVTIGVGAALVVLGVGAVVYGWRHPRSDVRRIVRESVVVLTFAAAVSVLAGIVLETRADVLLAAPALLVLFPPFVAMFGSLGGILSSRLTSKLHLGLLEPRRLPGKTAALDFSVTYLFTVVIFAFVGFATWAIALVLGLDAPSLGQLMGITLIGGLLGSTALSAVAYTAATATFRFGLDPDNHAIPIVTSVMDFVGMLCLVAAMAMLGVG